MSELEPSHQTVDAFCEFMPQCKFCDERGIHDCPGGEYSFEGGYGQIFPGKVDASIFKPCDGDSYCASAFSLCRCPCTWSTLRDRERARQALIRAAVGKAVHP